jgi:hypothetical protein
MMFGDAAAGLSAGTVQIIVASIGALGTVVSGVIAVVVARTHGVAKRTEENVNGRMTYMQNEIRLLRLQLDEQEREADEPREPPEAV